ncbi:MAG: hypothetical protein ACM3PW_13055 [Chlamydiota bacterium]
MTRISAILAALILASSVMVSSAAVPPAAVAAPLPPQAERRGPEPHPVIREAIKELQHTKWLLQHKAAHDFKGQRVQAIQSIDQAIAHLHQALEVDRK